MKTDHFAWRDVSQDMRKLLASLLFVTGCSAAYADQPDVPVRVAAAVGPRIAIASAPEKVRAPYDVQVLRESGETVPTYAQKDRFYVQGDAGSRYVIRVTNPTPNRVEAVVTVDGLDVVDGEPGDLRKRGYVIQPYGEVRIEGFRTSIDDVATFRFSSVGGAYAAQKGKARNIGVIAAAIFEEQPQPHQVLVRPNYDADDELDASRGRAPAEGGAVGRAEKAPAPATTAGRPAPSAPAKAMRPRDANYDDGGYAGEDAAPPPPAHERPGLGTEYGEQRGSSATYTRFMRSAGAPIAIAELRYNDAAGLMALGIPVQPLPDDGELMTRETADPFPGDARFARPAR